MASLEDQTGYEDEEFYKVDFRFCQECSNMLYPVENREDKCLVYTCRSCGWTEDATTPFVYRKFIDSTAGDTAGITQHVREDSTLPRIHKVCPNCDEQEAVFFQSQQRTADTGMKLYFVCCACNHVWQ